MPTILFRDRDSFEAGYRKFKRACERANIMNLYKENEYFEKPTTTRRKIKIAALRRNYVLYKLKHTHKIINKTLY
jgi:small subunit ribosomal protein S21